MTVAPCQTHKILDLLIEAETQKEKKNEGRHDEYCMIILYVHQGLYSSVDNAEMAFYHWLIKKAVFPPANDEMPLGHYVHQDVSPEVPIT